MTSLIEALHADAEEHEAAGRLIQAANARAAAQNLGILEPWDEREPQTGVQRIAAERADHFRRGFSLEHDLAHADGELIQAAGAFVHGNPALLPGGWGDGCLPRASGLRADVAHNLIIAGSLLAAELDCMAGRGEVSALGDVALGEYAASDGAPPGHPQRIGPATGAVATRSTVRHDVEPR